MTDAYTEYINAWNKAEFYANIARGYIETHFGDVESVLRTLYNMVNEILADLPDWNYNALIMHDEILNLLNLAKTTPPAKPSNIYNIPSYNPPEYTPTDTQLLKNALAQVMNVIATIPSRLTEGLALIDTLYNKIYTDLMEGGYGIEPSDEEALWARARDRELKNADTTIEEIKSKVAAFGYVVPPGNVLSAIQETINKAQDNISELNREITIKRADLFRDNRRFTMELARNVSGQLIDLTNYKVTALKNVTEAEIQEARLTLEAFHGEIELFKAQLEKAISEKKLLAEIWSTDVEAWAKRIELPARALQVLGSAVVQELEAIKSKFGYDLDKAKMFKDMWSRQIDVVSTKITQMSSILAASSSAAFSTLSGIFAKVESEEY